MLRVVVLSVLLVVVCSQRFPSNPWPCGFSCTRHAEFGVNIDNTFTTATCTVPGMNPHDRCPGCCQARALAAGLTTKDAAGFPSNNGVDCICCINNRCR
ncbi:unnamed protein product [Heligmosomoides polygyrus]|uniref:8.9 kDa family member n=1 Tax=Heligmosomoides polygyrus TaxID=6339 RepID=A0A183F3B3_HELPZ|nr:unnamed protein product [Heligmosomoides polygyrus]